MICSFLSSENEKIECFKECPFFLNINEENKCPFISLEKKKYIYKQHDKGAGDSSEVLLSLLDEHSV